MAIFEVRTKKMTMSKTTNFTGQLIFWQLLKFMSRARINSIIAKHDADRYVKKLTCHDTSSFFGVGLNMA
jgi:hypothetical protein